MAKFFGAEIIETGPGSAILTERVAATAMLVGTAPVGVVHADATTRAKYINQTITITREDQIAPAFGVPTPGYTIPSALQQMFAQAKTKGIGSIDVVNVFDPDVHTTVADVSAADIIGTFSVSGKPSGLKLAYSHYQKFGRFSKILLAPGFTGMVGVRAEMQTISNRTRARGLIDAPAGATVQQVIEARGPDGSFDFQFNDRRLVSLFPHMRFASTVAGETELSPYSASFAGIWLSSIMEYGYHQSPSNRALVIEDTEVPITYIPGDPSSDVQLLRAQGIVTCEERFGKGPHTSGNRSSAYPTDTDMRNLLHVQFIEDMMDEEVIHFLDQHKDRNGNPARIEFLEEGVNERIRALTLGDDPVLYGGNFRFDRTRTTPTSVVDSTFYWKLDYAPVGIMETLTVDRNIDIDLISNALGLASS